MQNEEYILNTIEKSGDLCNFGSNFEILSHVLKVVIQLFGDLHCMKIEHVNQQTPPQYISAKLFNNQEILHSTYKCFQVLYICLLSFSLKYLYV